MQANTFSPPNLIVLDTCVLISNILRKLFIRLSQHKIISPIWGEYIGEEWRRNASKVWDVPIESLQKEWDFLQEQFPHANMGAVHKYENHLRLSDPKDFHVIACGIAALTKNPSSHVAVITWNTKDFNIKELRNNQIGLYTPDQVLCLLWPEHKELISDFFELFANDLEDIGKPYESIEDVLKRERLFRLKKLWEKELLEIY